MRKGVRVEQRAKRRERESNGEEFIPQWFTKKKCDITGESYWAFTGKYWAERESIGTSGGKWEVEEIF